jgi:hypothetical protein
MDAVNPLNYAPRPRVAKRIWRWIYGLIFAAAIAVAAVEWAPGLYRYVQFLYWQHRCMVFVQPPNHVVFEQAGTQIVHTEQCRSVMELDSTLNGCTIYLHEMHQPDGTRLLIAVSLFPSVASGRSIELSIYPQISVAEWTIGPRPRELPTPVIVDWGGTAILWAGANGQHCKIYAGQPDANNPSHFTFDYEIDGTRYTADVWLKDGGQLVGSQRP